MADQGTIGVYREGSQRRLLDVWLPTAAEPNIPTLRQSAYPRMLPLWAQDHRALTAIPVNGVLSGVVRVQGTAVADYWVRLYYRPSGALIASARSAADGSFVFDGLDPAALYTVVAFDDLEQAPAYNAQIYDQLTPIVP